MKPAPLPLYGLLKVGLRDLCNWFGYGAQY